MNFSQFLSFYTEYIFSYLALSEINSYHMKTKRELKAAYKQQKALAGVFQLKNEKTGMLLIDAATNMSSKWNRHRTELKVWESS